MTFLEMFHKDYKTCSDFLPIACPCEFGYESDRPCHLTSNCTLCWQREIPCTLLEMFTKTFPKAKLDQDGTPLSICPGQLGYRTVINCEGEDACKRCWEAPYVAP